MFECCLRLCNSSPSTRTVLLARERSDGDLAAPTEIAHPDPSQARHWQKLYSGAKWCYQRRHHQLYPGSGLGGEVGLSPSWSGQQTYENL